MNVPARNVNTNFSGKGEALYVKEFVSWENATMIQFKSSLETTLYFREARPKGSFFRKSRRTLLFCCFIIAASFSQSYLTTPNYACTRVVSIKVWFNHPANLYQPIVQDTMMFAQLTFPYAPRSSICVCVQSMNHFLLQKCLVPSVLYATLLYPLYGNLVIIYMQTISEWSTFWSSATSKWICPIESARFSAIEIRR